MALISFSVFKDSILCGRKSHTIRDRAIPPIVGETLYLWWKPRTKEKDFIGVTVCTKVDSIDIFPFTHSVAINDRTLDDSEINLLAINDGFNAFSDFWAFFSKPLSGYLIHWDSSYINRLRIRPEVVTHAELESNIVDRLPKIFSPSNGTTGMNFCGDWCEQCDRDKDKTKGCHVLLKALADKTPRWIEHERQPICLDFVPLKSNSKSAIEANRTRSQERKGQLNLLG